MDTREEFSARAAREAGFLGMTRSTMSPGALAMFTVLLAGCGLGVLSSTATPDAGVDSGPPPLTVCDPATVTASCQPVCEQTQQILKIDCAACHEHVGITPALDDILDYHQLSDVAASPTVFPGWLLVVPGDPDRSLIYRRVGLGEMPPYSALDSTLPRPSISDISVLREWIQSCIPSVPGRDAGFPVEAGAGD